MPLSPQPTPRLFCAIGPGDALAAFEDWRQGVRTPSETSLTFSGQTYEAARRLGVPGLFVSGHPRRAEAADGALHVVNRPPPWPSARGAAFHIAQALHAARLTLSALRFRATHAVIDSGTAHWFLFAPLAWAGVQVIPHLHNTRWPAGHRPTGRVARWLLRLDCLFFRHCVAAALAVSPEGARQVAELSGGRTRTRQYRAQFVESDFTGLPPAPPLDGHRRLLFAGRVERDKGVFDLVDAVARLNRDGPVRYTLEVCGAGSAVPELEALLRDRGLADQVRLRGRLKRPDLLQAYADCHVVVVPTGPTFKEGFAMVCAEAALAGRPVVGSRVVPAGEVLGAAFRIAENDPDDLARVLRALLEDPAAYAAAVAATVQVRPQFVDRANGLTAALVSLLSGDAAPAPVPAVTDARP
jgi:glycogen synthase